MPTGHIGHMCGDMPTYTTLCDVGEAKRVATYDPIMATCPLRDLAILVTARDAARPYWARLDTLLFLPFSPEFPPLPPPFPPSPRFPVKKKKKNMANVTGMDQARP